VKPGVERPVNFRRLSRITVSGFTSLALRPEDTALLRALSSLDYNERRLGVEEQFYLVLPVFLIICWRFGMGTLFLATGVIAAVSLGLAEWGWRHTPIANFYLLPARAWELLVGSCIAYWHSPRWGRPVRASALARDVLTGCGLGLVGLSILTFDSTTPFPGLWALVPTIGAGLIIAFGSPHGYASSVLALRPVVLVGLISYSAYLWHQPVFAFARISTVGDLSTRAIFLCVGLSLGLAYVTWRWVETPFRNRQWLGRPTVLYLSLAGLVLGLGLGAAAMVRPGELGRFTPRAVSSVDGLRRPLEGCQPLPAGCPIGDPQRPPSFVLWGDSFAAALASGLDDYGRSNSISGNVYYMNGCPVVDMTNQGGRPCIEFRQRALQEILQDGLVRTVMLYARWPSYPDWLRLDGDPNGVERVPGEPAELAALWSRVEMALRETLSSLRRAGKRIVLIYPTPEFDGDVVAHARRSLRLSGQFLGLSLLRLPTTVAESHGLRATRALDSASVGLEVERIDPMPALCAAEFCSSGTTTALWYFDDRHLTVEGARRLITETRLAMLLDE
jgi:hypothetical protein